MTVIEKVSCFPSDGVPEVIPGSPQMGDLVRVITPNNAVFYQSYTPPPPPPLPRPVILSKTAFQDYAVSRLGGGMAGMGRFTEIMDATRYSASAVVRFAFARYKAAQTFEKANTETLTAVMVADDTAGHLTDEERASILDNWPTN